jgi:hypothetical protein
LFVGQSRDKGLENSEVRFFEFLFFSGRVWETESSTGRTLDGLSLGRVEQHSSADVAAQSEFERDAELVAEQQVVLVMFHGDEVAAHQRTRLITVW